MFTALFLWGIKAIIFLNNKQNNTWIFENMKFISRVEHDISLVGFASVLFSIYIFFFNNYYNDFYLLLTFTIFCYESLK